MLKHEELGGWIAHVPSGDPSGNGPPLSVSPGKQVVATVAPCSCPPVAPPPHCILSLALTQRQVALILCPPSERGQKRPILNTKRTRLNPFQLAPPHPKLPATLTQRQRQRPISELKAHSPKHQPPKFLVKFGVL